MIRKIIPIVLIILLLLFIRSRIEVLQELKNTTDSVEKIQEQLKAEKAQQALLTEQLKFVKSNEFIEEQAREKLNLTKKGEVLVVDLQIQGDNEPSLRSNKEKQVWEKWVEKFF